MLPTIAPSTRRKLRRIVSKIPVEVYGNLANSREGLVASTWYRGDHETTGDILPISSDTYYTYHTHPRAIYSPKNFTVAWPSVQDVEMVFHMISRRDPSQILHVLFTVEGIYYLDFPPQNREKAIQIHKRLSRCKEFPCCKNGGKQADNTAEFCQIFDQDTRRDRDRIQQYLSAAISHGTIRIRFERW